MEQVLSLYRQSNQKVKYVEYTIEADKYDVCNYLYSISCKDRLARELKNILIHMVEEEYINMYEILQLNDKSKNIIYPPIFRWVGNYFLNKNIKQHSQVVEEEVMKEKNVIFARVDLIDMIQNYFSYFTVKSTFELERDSLPRYYQAIARSNICKEEDVLQFEQGVESAVYNTKVFSQLNICFADVETIENLDTTTGKKYIYNMWNSKKKTS